MKNIATEKPAGSDVGYSYKTLLGYGKFTSGIGWFLVVAGFIAGVIIGAEGGGAAGVGAGIVSGIVIAILGLVMVITGQIASCFVSIERNTKATQTKLDEVTEIIRKATRSICVLKDP